MGIVEWQERVNLRGSAERRWPKHRGRTRYLETKSSCSRVALAQTDACRLRSAAVTSESEPSDCCFITAKPTSMSVWIPFSPRSECGSWWSASSTCECANTSTVSACPSPNTEGSQPPCRASRWWWSRRHTVSSANSRHRSGHAIQKTPESSRSIPSCCFSSYVHRLDPLPHSPRHPACPFGLRSLTSGSPSTSASARMLYACGNCSPLLRASWMRSAYSALVPPEVEAPAPKKVEAPMTNPASLNEKSCA
mmetsp:Transcript_26779/g.66245  ORF Transcript_26779/g.66245 Transcript_26779/m.66245 type:complete len:251 (+) Transcript_26779:464-1216(+)